MISQTDILNAKIMMVDDDPMSVMLMEDTLKAAGYTSFAGINDPREAAALYRELQPDLLLLDINMPHMDGYQVMETLNEFEKSGYLPVLVMTSQDDKDARVKALKSGARDFISKPFEKTETLTRIHNMMEVRLLHKRVKNQQFSVKP